MNTPAKRSRAASASWSFSEVFEQEAAFVLRNIRRLGVPSRDADDLAQEVFMIIHRKLASFRGDSKVRTWVYGITFRVVSAYYRKASTTREVLSEPPAEPGHDAHEQKFRDRLRQLQWALEQLPDEQRTTFVLFELEGSAMSEVAEQMNCPLHTAYTRHKKARTKVRALLKKEEQVEGKR